VLIHLLLDKSCNDQQALNGLLPSSLTDLMSTALVTTFKLHDSTENGQDRPSRPDQLHCNEMVEVENIEHHEGFASYAPTPHGGSVACHVRQGGSSEAAHQVDDSRSTSLSAPMLGVGLAKSTGRIGLQCHTDQIISNRPQRIKCKSCEYVQICICRPEITKKFKN